MCAKLLRMCIVALNKELSCGIGLWLMKVNQVLPRSVDTSSNTTVTRTRSLLEILKAPQASDLTRKRKLTVIHR